VKRLSVWLFALLFATPLWLSGQAMAQVSIMPVGDSITQGIRGECSYRRPLSQALIENSCNVDFVGSRITAGTGGTANSQPIAVCAPQNTDHQAISGYRADQILNNTQYNFTNELNNRQPDIVLLHIGSNDINQNQSVASTVNDIDAIIDRVFQQRPGATVVVADVIPWSEVSVTVWTGYPNANVDMLAVTAQLSAAIKTLVNNRAADGDSVVLVEVKDDFENDLMTIDGVHPNPVGEAFIANKMLTALYGLGVCGSSPTDVQPPITYITVPSEEYEQLTASPTLSGTALDEGGSGIDRVRIAIANSEGQWLNYVSGTFSNTFDSSIVATMSNTTNSSTSWSITTDLAPGFYRLYALALDENGNQVEESTGNGQPVNNDKVWTTRGFEVGGGTPPAKTTLISPSGNSSTSTPQYQWNAISDASWYLLWVDDDTGTPIKKWYTAADANCGSGTGVCSVTPSIAVSGGVRWWVQTWNSNGTGPWSESLGFSYGDVPGKAVLISPTGNVSNTPTYTWNAVSGSTWYYLWVDDSTGTPIKTWYTAAQAGCTNASSVCSVTPSTAIQGNATWWIQTWNSIGYGPWSAPLQFHFIDESALLTNPLY